MSINFEKVVEITQWLHLSKINYQKNHIEARCPFCGDSKTKKTVRRFHIDYYDKYDTYIYKCYRCGESSDIISLYAYFNNISYRDSSKILKNQKYNPVSIKKRLSDKNNIEIENISVDKELDIDLINNCYSIDYMPQSDHEKKILNKLINFKKDRKIPDNLPIYIAHSGRYSGRIIIPIYINNNMVYFQARSLYDNVLPKYLNPDVEKNKIILNIDNFDKDRWIIVTEGIIDAYAVNYNQGTCVIGGYIDTNFINILLQCTQKGVIICLDNYKIDNNSLNVLKKLISKNINKYKQNIKFFIMPEDYQAKDLNDLVTKYNINDIYDFVLNHSVSILKMKMILSMI